MPWNVDAHQRKFMVAKGQYDDKTGLRETGELVFWGEWEGPSRVVKKWPPDWPLPTYLHEPHMGEPPVAGFRQNTDPWVFGDRFHYSNCKQLTNKGRSSTSMQRLDEGSLILFGSSQKDRFVLDTTLVVGKRQGAYTARDYDHLDVSDAFRVATIESMSSADDAITDLELTLYDGATPDNRFEGMFSFVPCVPFNVDGPRFARPTIELPGVINPRSRQSTRGAHHPGSIAEVRECWETVIQQVFEQDLLLATRIELSEA